MWNLDNQQTIKKYWNSRRERWRCMVIHTKTGYGEWWRRTIMKWFNKYRNTKNIANNPRTETWMVETCYTNSSTQIRKKVLYEEGWGKKESAQRSKCVIVILVLRSLITNFHRLVTSKPTWKIVILYSWRHFFNYINVHVPNSYQYHITSKKKPIL